jgi:hypothetical protein
MADDVAHHLLGGWFSRSVAVAKSDTMVLVWGLTA